MSPPGEMQFGRLVETLLDRAVASGMKPQIIVVLVSINGYVRAVRYHMKHGLSS